MVWATACSLPSRSVWQFEQPTTLTIPIFQIGYFRRMVVNYMVNHRQLIYKNKFPTLMALYEVEEEALDMQRGWVPPLFFKEYLRQLLHHNFWGDEGVLYAISCMWNMKVTILNMKMLQEYRICHDHPLDGAEAGLTMPTITSMLWVGSRLSGRLVILCFQMWLMYWSPSH